MRTLNALLMMTLSAGLSCAAVINYDTSDSSFTGMFNGAGVNGTSISAISGTSSATLSYVPVVTGSTFDDAAPGTNISYGFFRLSFTGPDALITFPSFTFSLKVNESAPGVGSETISAISNNGTVSSNSSNINVFYVPTAFSLPSVVVPNTAFTIINPTQIVPSTTNGGISSVQGFAIGNSGTATPEPATLLIVGAGLLTIGFLREKLFGQIQKLHAS